MMITGCYFFGILRLFYCLGFFVWCLVTVFGIFWWFTGFWILGLLQVHGLRSLLLVLVWCCSYLSSCAGVCCLFQFVMLFVWFSLRCCLFGLVCAVVCLVQFVMLFVVCEAAVCSVCDAAVCLDCCIILLLCAALGYHVREFLFFLLFCEPRRATFLWFATGGNRLWWNK